jgi:hypothetical protein
LNKKICNNVEVPTTTDDVSLHLASTDSPPAAAVHLSFTEVHLYTNPNDISVYEDSAEGSYTPLPSANVDPVPLVDITQETRNALKSPNNSNIQVTKIFNNASYISRCLFTCAFTLGTKETELLMI